MNITNKTKMIVGKFNGGMSLMVQGAFTTAGRPQRVNPLAKHAHGTSDNTPAFAQSSIHHIDHYIDGLSAPRRERKPFDPIAYMRTGKGAVA
jgi:hypothetical protein